MRLALALTALTASLALAATPAAAVTTSGPPRPITSERAYSPSIAHDSRRDAYLVTFVRDNRADPSSTIARRLDGAGIPRGGEVRVTGPTLGDALAYNRRRDEYLLVWRTQPAKFGDPYELRGQRLSAAGRPLGAARTLLRASEQGERHLNCCEEVRLVHDPRRDGYLLTWRAEVGTLGPMIVMARRVAPDLRTGPARRLNGATGVFVHDVVRTGDGYVVATSSVRRIDGEDFGIRTRRVDPSGRPRGDESFVYAGRGTPNLERNERTGLLALAWGTREEGLNVLALDGRGRPTGDGTVVDARPGFPDTTAVWLSYNRHADRFLLGWLGTRFEDDQYFDEYALTTLAGDASRRVGGVRVSKAPLGAVAASSRRPRWVGVLAPFELTAQAFGP